MAIEVIRELDDFTGSACLVRKGFKFYVVSTAEDPYTGIEETLAFPSDADGNVLSWGEVAGGRHATREEVIQELAKMNK